jgi:two-component system, OmpR family, sensor kinase
MNSLRFKLTVALLLVTALVGLLATAAVYVNARQEIEELFDYELRAVAESIDPHGISPRQERSVGRLPDDDVLVQMWSSSGQLVYRSDPSRAVPRPFSLGYETLTAGLQADAIWRSYTLSADDSWIQVAQSLETRRELALEQALRLLAPELLALPLLGAMIGWVVKHNLKPVRELGDALAQRTQGSTDPVPSAALPGELLPLVAGFNKMLERLAKAMATQRAVVADAAHELRTPLAAVRLQAQHLRRLQSPEERDAAHESLARGIDRMTRLVAQLLTLARLEPGAARDRANRVCMDRLAREVLAELIPLANDRGVELSLACESSVEVRAEAAGLRALVGNLVDNALRYTPTGGAVAVTISRSADVALLVVSDNGPGLAEHQRELVLQRFYRVPGSPGNGSGLGLAIAAAVVQRQGGKIELLKAEQGGLRVEVRLPMPEDAGLPPAFVDGLRAAGGNQIDDIVANDMGR